MSLLNIELSPYGKSMHDEHHVLFSDFLQKTHHAYVIYHLPDSVLSKKIMASGINCTVVNWKNTFEKTPHYRLGEEILSAWNNLVEEDTSQLMMLILPRLDIEVGQKLFNQMRVNLNTTGLEETPCIMSLILKPVPLNVIYSPVIY